MRSPPPEGEYWDLDEGASYHRNEEYHDDPVIAEILADEAEHDLPGHAGTLMLYGLVFHWRYGYDPGRIRSTSKEPSRSRSLMIRTGRTERLITLTDRELSPMSARNAIKLHIYKKCGLL